MNPPLADDDGTPVDRVVLALAAASALGDAQLDLIEFARHGYDTFSGDPPEHLADALRMVIAIENQRPLREAEKELLGQLDHALFLFLEDWPGS